MQVVMENMIGVSAQDASLIARLASLRESVRGHKERALAMWNDCRIDAEPEDRATLGRFTQKLVPQKLVHSD